MFENRGLTMPTVLPASVICSGFRASCLHRENASSFTFDTDRLVNIGSKMVVFHQVTLPPGQGTLGKAWRHTWLWQPG